MLREPNPANQNNVMAVLGFALLTLQSNLYAQADVALKKVITLIANADSSKSKSTLPTRQQATILIAAARLALLNSDFGQASKNCASAMAIAQVCMYV